MDGQAVSRGVAVIGIGCAYRRDDGVGPAVIERLTDMCAGTRALPDLATLATCDGDLTRLLAAWEGKASAFLVDAARSGGRAHPGTVSRFGFPLPTFPFGPSSASSHSLGLAEAVALGRALDRLPGSLVLYTVEAADTGSGHGLSPSVAAAVGDVAERIAAELGAVCTRSG